VDKAALHASDPLVEPASTNLSTFSLSGGKLIFFHGDSDPWFSPLDTLDYYKSLAATNSGPEKVSEWSRIFLVPGMATALGAPASIISICSAPSSTGSRKARRPIPLSLSARHSPAAAARSAHIQNTLNTPDRVTPRMPATSDANNTG